MPINTVSEPLENRLRIMVDGRFDFTQLQAFRSAYENLEPFKDYVVDLKQSNYIDSSALGMLLSLRDYAGGEQSNVIICNCSSDIKKILMITKLDELFKID